MPDDVKETSEENMSLGRCKLTCDPNSVLWPRPRRARLGSQVTLFRPMDLGYSSHGKIKANYTDMMLKERIEEQKEFLTLKKVIG